GELTHDAARALDCLGGIDGSGNPAVVLERLERRRRHRVDGVGTDQFLDVADVAVARVLGAGTGPQRPLYLATLVGERRPLAAREDLLEAGVGEPRIG